MKTTSLSAENHIVHGWVESLKATFPGCSLQKQIDRRRKLPTGLGQGENVQREHNRTWLLLISKNRMTFSSPSSFFTPGGRTECNFSALTNRFLSRKLSRNHRAPKYKCIADHTNAEIDSFGFVLSIVGPLEPRLPRPLPIAGADEPQMTTGEWLILAERDVLFVTHLSR